MITVSVKQLINAIEEADAFRLPEMNTGTTYLYNSIYGRLSMEENITLSSIDFDAFESEDISILSGLYSDIFERNNCIAKRVKCSLQKIKPAYKSISYI